jgi:hypothetical protein
MLCLHFYVVLYFYISYLLANFSFFSPSISKPTSYLYSQLYKLLQTFTYIFCQGLKGDCHERERDPEYVPSSDEDPVEFLGPKVGAARALNMQDIAHAEKLNNYIIHEFNKSVAFVSMQSMDILCIRTAPCTTSGLVYRTRGHWWYTGPYECIIFLLAD